jgi:hypothetical protein
LPKGERLRAGIPHGHWKTTTFVAGLRLTGMMATMVLDGPINRDALQAYVEQLLVRELWPGDVVIMDNLSSHKSVAIRQAIEAASASLLFLPPYSPDFKRLCQGQGPAQSCRRANRRRPVDHHRKPHRPLHAGRTRKLLRRRRLRCNMTKNGSSRPIHASRNDSIPSRNGRNL